MDWCRLTELKAESRIRREQREIDSAMLVAETKRRREIVEKHFYEWNDGKKVDCTLILTALQTYADMYDGSLLFTRPLDDKDKDQGAFYLADYMAVRLCRLLSSDDLMTLVQMSVCQYVCTYVCPNVFIQF